MHCSRASSPRRVRSVLAVVVAVASLVASSCSSGGDNDRAGEDPATENEDSAASVRRTRYQDAWVFTRIATVDLEGEVVDLTEDVIALAGNLDEAIPLVDGSEFVVWPELHAHLVDFDESVREDVDVVSGILHNDVGEALVIVATPNADDTPPIDHDDQFRFDLTALGDGLRPGDPMVFEYAFAHTYGPDDADAPDTGPALFAHRAAEQRIGYVADEATGEPEIATDLGQAYEGSTMAGGGAKCSAMK